MQFKVMHETCCTNQCIQTNQNAGHLVKENPLRSGSVVFPLNKNDSCSFVSFDSWPCGSNDQCPGLGARQALPRTCTPLPPALPAPAPVSEPLRLRRVRWADSPPADVCDSRESPSSAHVHVVGALHSSQATDVRACSCIAEDIPTYCTISGLLCPPTRCVPTK